MGFPREPLSFRGLDTLPIHAPYHSILGDRGRGDTPNSSDGVVAYWSSHLTGAKSELIVPGPHGSFALPQTVSELKRILLLNLAVVGPLHRDSMPKAQRSLAGTSSEQPDRSFSRDQSLTPRDSTGAKRSARHGTKAPGRPQSSGENSSQQLGLAVIRDGAK